MALVVLADDAYAFMVMWETMALSSFFLVIANHRIPEIRSAGYLYLLIAHIGALGILLCFGAAGRHRRLHLRQHAGPVAHAASGPRRRSCWRCSGSAPRPAWCRCTSGCPRRIRRRLAGVALMSAVMLKTAVYGVLRVSFDLLHGQVWWWGVVLLALGLASALFGVVFAAAQVDMKRLLAYSSIENIGLLFAGIGLAVLFSAYDMKPMAALALTPPCTTSPAMRSSRACCSSAPAPCCMPPASAAWASSAA